MSKVQPRVLLDGTATVGRIEVVCGDCEGRAGLRVTVTPALTRLTRKRS
jgi:hypothetical protein